MKKRDVIVKQAEDNPIPVEVMAESIKAIAEGVRRLRSTRLNEKALVLLIQHACPSSYKHPKPSASDVRAVLEGIEGLEHEYLKPIKSNPTR